MCAVRAVDVPVLVCLRSSCSHVTDVVGPLRFVSLALTVVMQNDGDFVEIILLYVFPLVKPLLKGVKDDVSRSSSIGR